MSQNDDENKDNDRLIDDGDLVNTDTTLKSKEIELNESKMDEKLKPPEKQEKNKSDNSDKQ